MAPLPDEHVRSGLSGAIANFLDAYIDFMGAALSAIWDNTTAFLYYALVFALLIATVLAATFILLIIGEKVGVCLGMIKPCEDAPRRQSGDATAS